MVRLCAERMAHSQCYMLFINRLNLINMELFIDIKNKVHDSSGIEKPQNYYWGKDVTTNNIYYPIKLIDEDEIHEEIREFLYENNNLPNVSLDEIGLDVFTPEQLERRDFFMSMF